ncbi:MAG: hypothetical protein AAFQ82_25720, partial [Myxococcota bacterium]
MAHYRIAMILACLTGCGSETVQPVARSTQQQLEQPTPEDSGSAIETEIHFDSAPDTLFAPADSATDFYQKGPYGVSASSERLELDGCNLSYAVFEPVDVETDVWMILGHGFSRNEERMADLAEHVASYGIAVATPRYCFSGPFRVDHPRNAQNAV